VKEFAQLDGVFVIDKSGEIRSAGRYLDVTGRGILASRGARGEHRATASITYEIPAIGITVSESGGMVRVFRDGICKIGIRSDIRIRSDG